MVTIISLGGSIVAPEAVDTEFLARFIPVIETHLQKNVQEKIIFIVGGGGPARIWQAAYRALREDADSDAQDWIGVMATRLNAELIRACFSRWCPNPVVTDPSADFGFDGRILVAAGWKPGFSTDFDAVYLAERFEAKRVLNLSNIEKVYSDDPKKNPAALALDEINWKAFRKMVGDSWEPGKNAPFDPIASKKAEELDLEVIVASGRNLENLEKLLEGKKFVGTLISSGS